MSELKIAVVVMAHNPYQYLSEFLCHHSNIVDHIYLIDHRSSRQLTGLNISGLTVIDCVQVAQFQSEVTNTIIRDFGIYEIYDWVFVLDVDEFLPFKSREQFETYLQGQARHKVVAFNWRNGVGVFPTGSRDPKESDSLYDLKSLLISDFLNPNIKVGVNCSRLKYPFYFRTGAHEVVARKPLYFLFHRSQAYRTVKPAKSFHFLFHIVCFDRPSFYKKISNYVEQMEMRKHVKGQGGWMVKDYLTDFDDNVWLEIVQNFRVSRSENLMQDVSEECFSRVGLFDHLNPVSLHEMKRRISRLKRRKTTKGVAAERHYLENKKLDTDIATNIESFKVTSNQGTHEIVVCGHET